MTVTTTTTTTEDFGAMKARLKATWMAGNYDYFSRFMESSAVEFADRVGVKKGDRWLDVASGSGQLALLAARRGATVTGVDIATNSIEAARGRAAAEGLDARFDEGDAEALPYDDASFDIVATIFGAMFAPRPDVVASELLRVCRPGGTIAMANWTKEGFVGTMFGTIGRYLPPSPVPSPVLWGNEDVVRDRFGAGVSTLRLTRVTYCFDYPFSPAGTVEFFGQYYGPLTRAFAALGDSERTSLSAELTDLWASHNLAAERGHTHVDAEYLEVIATRR